MKPQSALSTRRRLMQLAAAATAGACLALGLAAQAQAQGAFPNRPIKIIVPYSPGTGSDVLARTVAQSITEKAGRG